MRKFAEVIGWLWISLFMLSFGFSAISIVCGGFLACAGVGG